VHNRKSSLHQTGSLANAWTYNAHHQLTQYGDPTATSSSSLASILHPKVTQTYNANGHLTTKTVTPEDTSPAGLQAGKQSQRYTYSVSERLLRISDGSSANNGQGAEIARYAYDPFGRRIKKTVSQTPSGQGSTGTTLYFYADEGLIAEVDGSPTTNGGNITTTYGWMPASANTGTWGTAPQWKRDHAGQSGATDVQGSANTNGITHYVHVDHLGTSQRLTNTQGETTWRAVSEAFGKTFVDTTLAPATTGATTNNLRFPGQYEDPETGTYYNWNRDYLPHSGRYIQSDPIGIRGGINTFVYVDAAATRDVDPSGLFGPAGAAGGAAFSILLQMSICTELGTDFATCMRCVDWIDVGVSAFMGFVFPTWLGNVGKGIWKFKQTKKTLIVLGGPGLGGMASTSLRNSVRGAATGTAIGTGMKAILPPARLTNCPDECPKLPVGEEVMGFLTSLR
jgi:RHS repeat-associated protein